MKASRLLGIWVITGLIFRVHTGRGDSVKLIPFYQLFDQRYALYWKTVEEQ